MADEQAVATRSLMPLGVGYLVWHCISKLAILVILMFTTLAYAGIYSVQGQLPQTVSLMGFDVSAWLFIGGSWAILTLVTLAGISFAVSALTFQREHVRLTRAIILGRIMFALCVIDLLTSVVQGDSVSIITGSVSLVLTGSLALEVRRASKGIDQDAPQKSFVAEAIDEEPARLESLSDAARSRFRATSGYATIMLVWGALRVLYGIATLISLPLASGARYVMYGLASSLVIMCVGVYLIVAGRYGKTALSGSGKLDTFMGLCRIGVIVAGAALVLFVFLLLGGLAPAAGETFCAVVDLALCGAGLFSGSKLNQA